MVFFFCDPKILFSPDTSQEPNSMINFVIWYISHKNVFSSESAQNWNKTTHVARFTHVHHYSMICLGFECEKTSRMNENAF